MELRESVGVMLQAAKNSSGMPIRRLASEAHLASSTITRIQSGLVDPTYSTLERAFGAAGFEIHLQVIRRGVPSRPSLGVLARAWSQRRGRLTPDWTAWRSLLDTLALHPEWVPEAIYTPPPPAGSVVIDAMLAATAEKLADDAGLPRPSWTEAAPVLDEPYLPPVARVAVDRPVPEQFSDRGVLVDEASLWRPRANVGL